MYGETREGPPQNTRVLPLRIKTISLPARNLPLWLARAERSEGLLFFL